MHNPMKPWMQLFISKYPGEDVGDMLQHKGSYLTTSLGRAYPSISSGFQLELGNGNCSFWYDNWWENSFLSLEVPYVHLYDKDLHVRDVMSDDGWHLDQLYSMLPQISRINLLRVELFFIRM